MAPEPNRLSDLFARASKLAPEDRRAFLQGACGDDDALREDVESLLRYEAASFLEAPAARVAGVGPGTPMIDRQLGPYTIVAPLGAGGMGEVHRARDTKLGRDVAIKILPAHFTADPERRARFAREARVLATLDHPHIGAIYGVEESDGVTALVLALVDGPTLADRLERGPLPVGQALAIARQIADALDAAHEKGIVHRDLKPANIVLQGAELLSSDPRVKVLDFGLAKSMAAEHGPTVSLDATAEGRILGTPAYMSPEQARGMPVDKRTDIWAFGCVLFEMLSGRRPFHGATITDTLARILEHEPDWSVLPHDTPPAIRTLIERCLRKDPRKRLHDIADALIELEDRPQSSLAREVVTEGRVRRGHGFFGWIAAAVLVVAFGAMFLIQHRETPTAQPPERLEFPIAPAEGSRFSWTAPEFALSPDGKHVAFVATSRPESMLWVRSMATLEPRPLPGTERARNPFWSPDSQSIGFFADEKLKTIHPGAGPPAVVCAAVGSAFALGPSGTWSSNDVILFADRRAGLMRVDAKGGQPNPVPTVDNRDSLQMWPWFLPDANHFLYLNQQGGKNELRVGALTTSENVSLGAAESHGVHVDGYLFFVRDGELIAQPFDERTSRPKGDPRRLGLEIGILPPFVRGMFSVSNSGRLLYRSVGRALSRLSWVDRRGASLGTVGDPGAITAVSLSRDDQRVAAAQVSRRSGAAPEFDIWLTDVAGGRATRLTDDAPWEFDPAWSPDGTQVAFTLSDAGTRGASLFLRATNASGQNALLVKAPTGRGIAAPDWSTSNVIVYDHGAGTGSDTQRDLYTLSVYGDRRPTVFLSTPHDESAGAFSPDGRWIAYQSDESNRREVYVRPFPARDPVYRISRDGGGSPRWRGDGKELYFLGADGTMMAVPIGSARGFDPGVPRKLFPSQLPSGNSRPYAVARNGQRFLIPMAAAEQPPLRAIQDWHALLTK